MRDSSSVVVVVARAMDDDENARFRGFANAEGTEQLTLGLRDARAGMHIETALKGVAVEDRCACPRGSIFGSLFGSSSKKTST